MSSRLRCFLFGLVAAGAQPAVSGASAAARWSEERSATWYAGQPWLVGANYIPATAINQLEMWQAGTFDPQRIELELGWAEAIGMNTMRVFLHDLPWEQDARGFRGRIDRFLALASRHRIRPMLVIFDSCWDPNPHLGGQHAPIPGVHNSGWVQSPGRRALGDPAQYPRLEAYVKGVVGAFARDPRILAWDIWNEPDNLNASIPPYADGSAKLDAVNVLLPRAFAWARSAHPVQPLTSAVWSAPWAQGQRLGPVERIQLQESDVVSFHNYGDPADFESEVRALQAWRRPLICSEYMARPRGSTFRGILPIARRYQVAAINWGFAAGKTQTYYPWDSWEKPYVQREPAVWFHEVFRTDGTPYRGDETDFIRQITASVGDARRTAPARDSKP